MDRTIAQTFISSVHSFETDILRFRIEHLRASNADSHFRPESQGSERSGWLHEVKYDGFRMLLQRENDRLRLLTMNGHDWRDRFP